MPTQLATRQDAIVMDADIEYRPGTRTLRCGRGDPKEALLRCSLSKVRVITSMRGVFLLTLLVLALASRALAGGAGGEYAVDVHDGEPFDDDATPNARASEYAPAEEETHEEETHVEGDVIIDSPASTSEEEAETHETPRASAAAAEEEAEEEETHVASAMDDPPASTDTTMEVHEEEDVQLDHGDVASASQRRAAETEALEAEALAAAWADDAQTPQEPEPEPEDPERVRRRLAAEDTRRREEDTQWARERKAYANLDKIYAELAELGAGDYDQKTAAKRQGLETRLAVAKAVVEQLERRGANMRAEL